MFKKILLASDGSEGAKEAALAAAHIARRYLAELTVLYVFDPPLLALSSDTENLTGGIDPTSAAEWEQAASETVAQKVHLALSEAGMSHYTFRHETGYPAAVIVRIARIEKYDLIVVGSRGLSGVKEFLLGSVSNRVAHHAPCPVLIAR